MLKFRGSYNLRVISLLVALVFFLNSTVYGIDLSEKAHLRTHLMGNSKDGQDRLKQTVLYASIGIGNAVRAENDEDVNLFDVQRRALLLPDGNILLTQELYEQYLQDSPEAIQVIVHEIVEALLQVIKHTQPERYQSIKDLALNNLAALYFNTDRSDEDYRDEVLANDIWAVILEHRFMDIDPKEVSDPNLAELLRTGYDIIATNYVFGEEFNSLYRSRETVMEWLRKGEQFDVASFKPHSNGGRGKGEGRGRGSTWDRHSGKRPGGPEKGDNRRPVDRSGRRDRPAPPPKKSGSPQDVFSLLSDGTPRTKQEIADALDRPVAVKTIEPDLYFLRDAGLLNIGKRDRENTYAIKPELLRNSILISNIQQKLDEEFEVIVEGFKDQERIIEEVLSEIRSTQVASRTETQVAVDQAPADLPLVSSEAMMLLGQRIPGVDILEPKTTRVSRTLTVGNRKRLVFTDEERGHMELVAELKKAGKRVGVVLRNRWVPDSFVTIIGMEDGLKINGILYPDSKFTTAVKKLRDILEPDIDESDPRIKIQQLMNVRGPVDIIDAVWDYIGSQIEAYDDYVTERTSDGASYLARLYHTLHRTMESLAQKTRHGNSNPFAMFDSTYSFPEGEEEIKDKAVRSELEREVAQRELDVELIESEREINVGFLPMAGNPFNWGHALIAFMAMDKLGLDAVVYRVQGKIGYKDLAASEKVPATIRHGVVKALAHRMFPFMRHVNLGATPKGEVEDKTEGPEALYEFFEMNHQRKMHVRYLLGVEHETRVRHYLNWHYREAHKHKFGKNPNHRLTIAFIQRGDNVPLWRILEIAAEERERLRKDPHNEYEGRYQGLRDDLFDITLVEDSDIDLEVSSTHYRLTGDQAFVPELANRIAKRHGFWGNIPIDPQTGEPVATTLSEYFRQRLRPYAETLGNEIMEMFRPGRDVVMVSIDGASGSGKSSFAEELAKYMEDQGYELVRVTSEGGEESDTIPLDMYLDDRVWRHAIEKLVIREALLDEEKDLVRASAEELMAGDELQEAEKGTLRAVIEKVITRQSLEKKKQDNALALLGRLIAEGSLSDREKAFVGGLIHIIAGDPRQPYIYEEGFFDQPAIFAMLQAIGEFVHSDRETSMIDVCLSDGETPAYNQQTKRREKRTIQLKRSNKKGLVVIVEGKFANREELAPLFDVCCHLRDHPDRTKAYLQVRTRTLSPDDEYRHIRFNDLGFVATFDTYTERTDGSIDFIIDISGKDDDWKIVDVRGDDGNIAPFTSFVQLEQVITDSIQGTTRLGAKSAALGLYLGYPPEDVRLFVVRPINRTIEENILRDIYPEDQKWVADDGVPGVLGFTSDAVSLVKLWIEVVRYSQAVIEKGVEEAQGSDYGFTLDPDKVAFFNSLIEELRETGDAEALAYLLEAQDPTLNVFLLGVEKPAYLCFNGNREIVNRIASTRTIATSMGVRALHDAGGEFLRGVMLYRPVEVIKMMREQREMIEAWGYSFGELFKEGHISPKRDDQGRFAGIPGKSPEYMRDFVATNYGDRPFTIAQYIKDWEIVNTGRRMPQSTAYDDLKKAREEEWIEPAETRATYRLTEKGKLESEMPARARNLRQYVTAQSTDHEIFQVDISSKDPYFSDERMKRAIEDGKVIALDLSDLMNLSAEERYRTAQLIFSKIGVIYGYGENTFDKFCVEELLKNALVHGNKLRLDLPIFFYFKLNDEKTAIETIRVFDMAISWQIANMEDYTVARLTGTAGGQGAVYNIGLERDYDRQAITGPDGNTIGTRATVSPKAQKETRIAEQVATGQVPSDTKLKVETEGLSLNQVHEIFARLEGPLQEITNQIQDFFLEAEWEISHEDGEMVLVFDNVSVLTIEPWSERQHGALSELTSVISEINSKYGGNTLADVLIKIVMPFQVHASRIADGRDLKYDIFKENFEQLKGFLILYRLTDGRIFTGEHIRDRELLAVLPQVDRRGIIGVCGWLGVLDPQLELIPPDADLYEAIQAMISPEKLQRPEEPAEDLFIVLDLAIKALRHWVKVDPVWEHIDFTEEGDSYVLRSKGQEIAWFSSFPELSQVLIILFALSEPEGIEELRRFCGISKHLTIRNFVSTMISGDEMTNALGEIFEGVSLAPELQQQIKGLVEMVRTEREQLASTGSVARMTKGPQPARGSPVIADLDIEAICKQVLEFDEDDRATVLKERDLAKLKIAFYRVVGLINETGDYLGNITLAAYMANRMLNLAIEEGDAAFAGELREFSTIVALTDQPAMREALVRRFNKAEAIGALRDLAISGDVDPNDIAELLLEYATKGNNIAFFALNEIRNALESSADGTRRVLADPLWQHVFMGLSDVATECQVYVDIPGREGENALFTFHPAIREVLDIVEKLNDIEPGILPEVMVEGGIARDGFVAGHNYQVSGVLDPAEPFMQQISSDCDISLLYDPELISIDAVRKAAQELRYDLRIRFPSILFDIHLRPVDEAGIAGSLAEGHELADPILANRLRVSLHRQDDQIVGSVSATALHPESIYHVLREIKEGRLFVSQRTEALSPREALRAIRFAYQYGWRAEKSEGKLIGDALSFLWDQYNNLPAAWSQEERLLYLERKYGVAAALKKILGNVRDLAELMQFLSGFEVKHGMSALDMFRNMGYNLDPDAIAFVYGQLPTVEQAMEGMAMLPIDVTANYSALNDVIRWFDLGITGDPAALLLTIFDSELDLDSRISALRELYQLDQRIFSTFRDDFKRYPNLAGGLERLTKFQEEEDLEPRSSSPGQAVLAEYNQDVEHLREVRETGFGALSPEARAVLYNFESAEWGVNFTPKVYYELYNFLLNPIERGRAFLEENPDLFNVECAGDIDEAIERHIALIIQATALKEVDLSSDEMDILLQYIELPRDSMEEQDEKLLRYLKLIEPGGLDAHREVIDKYAAVYAHLYAETVRWSAERLGPDTEEHFGQGDERGFLLGPMGTAVGDYIRDHNLLMIHGWHRLGEARYCMLRGRVSEAAIAFKLALLNRRDLYGLPESEVEGAYSAATIEELNPQAISLVLDEFLWMQRMRVEGIDDISETLRIPELLDMQERVPSRGTRTGA